MHTEFLIEVCEVIKLWLLDHGGMSNGYATYVEGYLNLNSNHITFLTPSTGDLTGKELKKLSNELRSKIAFVMERHNVSELIIKKLHLEHGCYDTIISVCESKRVSL